MKTSRTKTPKVGGRTYSVPAFVKRVVATLIALVIVACVVAFLLVYLPLKAGLEKSLMDNFYQLAFIRYTSLQISIDRGVEGARSLSSRSVIRDAILRYQSGEIDMDALVEATQSRYQDGAMALEYLIRAERFVDDTKIAGYVSRGYKAHSCATDDRLVKGDEISAALCLTDSHAYYAMLSPLLSNGQVIGYDKLIFDLSDQIRLLCTDTIQSELIYHDEFENFTANASMVQNSDTSSLFYKEGFYYQSFTMQDNTHFVSKQSAASLLDPVNQLSKQIFQVGVGVLLSFTAAVYFFVIRFAANEMVYLEDSRRTLKKAVSEANIDPLTGVDGRRFGEEILTSAFASFQMGKPSPAIVLFDIDSLKQINDTHGHSVGDRVIRAIAKAVHKNIRSGDMLLRWGGDEFVGIFGGLNQENALPFAQKLLKAVSGLTVAADDGIIHPTISIGVSYFNEEDRSFLEAINRADRAMYQSKAEGRNRAHAL